MVFTYNADLPKAPHVGHFLFQIGAQMIERDARGAEQPAEMNMRIRSNESKENTDGPARRSR